MANHNRRLGNQNQSHKRNYFFFLFKINLYTIYRPKPLGSHGLCPVMYNNAVRKLSEYSLLFYEYSQYLFQQYFYQFKYKFMAIDKARTCTIPIYSRDVIVLPSEGIRMGYYQKLYNSTLFTGVNLYAITKRDHPYC